MSDLHSEFEQLYREHWRYLRRCVLSYLDSRFRADLEDVLQSGFLHAWQSRHGYKGTTVEDLKRWVATIMQRTAADYRNRKMDRMQDPSVDVSRLNVALQQPTPEQALINRQRETQVAFAFSQLPRRFQLAFTTPGIDRNKERNTIYRGKQMMRDLIATATVPGRSQ